MYQIHIQSNYVPVIPRHFAVIETLNYIPHSEDPTIIEKGYKTQLHFVGYGIYSSTANWETQILSDIQRNIPKFLTYSKISIYFHVYYTNHIHKVITPINKPTQ